MALDGTFDEYPLHLPGHEAVLLGTARNLGSFDEVMVAYYQHAYGNVAIGHFTYNERKVDGIPIKGDLTPRLATEETSSLMGKQARAFIEDVGGGADIRPSPVGEALRDADRIAKHDVLGVKQAYVYSLKNLHGFSRAETATVLNVPPNTVDRHRQDAEENVEDAEAFIDLLTEIRQPD